MKPEKRARYAAAITLSKGKMYEYGIPEHHHLELPKGLDLEMQFPSAVGTIGDFASETVSRTLGHEVSSDTSTDEIVFSAQVLQAFDDSLLNRDVSSDLRLLAAAGFYLGTLPGSAAVQLSKLDFLINPKDDLLGIAVRTALDAPWNPAPYTAASAQASTILEALCEHFKSGAGIERAKAKIEILRRTTYAAGSAHELLMSDLLGAITATRFANSAWTLLPRYSSLPREQWAPYLARYSSIKELWPSQRMLGEAGVYKGRSAVVQMPTSAGKSRATELVIRSAFLSARTKLALVIAPFRALCQEIATDLKRVFRDDGYNVSQVSDALQQDLDPDLFDLGIQSTLQVLVLTPEKLLYLIRQIPHIVEHVGLVVYDEGHQFDTGARGVTYELLLTSIKRALPGSAQSLLISAVIQNASTLAAWLLRDETSVISDSSLQTARLIAFASLPMGKDGQLQFNAASDTEQKFFVPRVIVREKLQRLPKDKTDRVFPTADSGSVALYISLRLLANGGVAIYAGRKASASKIVRDAVEEVFCRRISLPSALTYSDVEEIRRFVNLYTLNFGPEAYLTKAAALGVFAHHGNTPQGVRLAIEHAMRGRLIRLIVCTSTLAQGVNLPIRYLLVTSPMQGRASIRARDFHNLMGRAGRAGMYGEGTVIFTDHRLYDERNSEPDRWSRSVRLVNPGNAEPTGSTLLSIFDPLQNEAQTLNLATPAPAKIVSSIISDWSGLNDAVGRLSPSLLERGFSTTSLREQLKTKKMIVEAVESFLMTHRGTVNSQTFLANCRALATETFAYSIATTEQQSLLADLFEFVARKIESQVSDTTRQLRFGRSLLGMDDALAIDAWINDRVQLLAEIGSSDDLLDVLWPLLAELMSTAFCVTRPL